MSRAERPPGLRLIAHEHTEAGGGLQGFHEAVTGGNRRPEQLRFHLQYEHAAPVTGDWFLTNLAREHVIHHHAIRLYEATPTVDAARRPWWTRPEDERERWLRMARDEMVAEEHDEHDALGRALYERRRPTGTPWDELDKASRDEWTVIAFDHEYGLAVVTSGTTATVDAQVRAVDTRDPELRPGAAEQVGPELAEKLRRVWMSGKPIEPGGRIDWRRFAEALITDEGVRP